MLWHAPQCPSCPGVSQPQGGYLRTVSTIVHRQTRGDERPSSHHPIRLALTNRLVLTNMLVLTNATVLFSFHSLAVYYYIHFILLNFQVRKLIQSSAFAIRCLTPPSSVMVSGSIYVTLRNAISAANSLNSWVSRRQYAAIAFIIISVCIQFII